LNTDDFGLKAITIEGVLPKIISLFLGIISWKCETGLSMVIFYEHIPSRQGAYQYGGQAQGVVP